MELATGPRVKWQCLSILSAAAMLTVAWALKSDTQL